jgi:hypothetical protein
MDGAPSVLWLGDWVGSNVGLHAVEDKKLLLPQFQLVQAL